MWLWAGLIAFGTVFASLRPVPEVWVSIAGAAVLTVALTFALPFVHAPGKLAPAEPDSESTGTL